MRTRSYGSSRPFNRPLRRPSFRGRVVLKGQGRGENIDPSRFINKAIITEEVDNFVPEHLFEDFKLEQRLKQAITFKNYKP